MRKAPRAALQARGSGGRREWEQLRSHAQLLTNFALVKACEAPEIFDRATRKRPSQ